jgi:predicted MFS family arabinose efflux permease
MSGGDAEQGGRRRLADTFAALRHRNYRLWFLGQLVSMLGSWMQFTAQGYLVYDLTHSARYLGLVAFAAGLPSWLLMLFGGVVADRVSRRDLMVLTQAALMLLAVVLAALTFLGLVQPWHIVVLAFLAGVANAFDAPARQAIVLELVERRDLTNAITLNSFLFNAATAVGPAAAGLTYEAAGPGWCFTLNAVSFVAVLAALVLLRVPPTPRRERTASAWDELREGLGYVRREPTVLSLMAVVAFLSVFGLAVFTLVPAWAVRVLGGDASTTGFLQSARGVGALTGALLVAMLGQRVERYRLLRLASFAFPAALLAFATWRSMAGALVSLAAVGLAMLLTLNLCNALIQSLVPDGLRGRVMALYSLTFFGGMPLGGLLAGVAADHVGEPWTVAASAALTLLAALVVHRRLRAPDPT